MSWLFFMDESGHDHKQCPYEVRGGVALHAGKLWGFVQAMQRLELQAFGCQLSQFGNEIKGSTLLDRKRFKFAGQRELMTNMDRQKNARSFLEKSHRNQSPSGEEFAAYGQACVFMAQGIFQVINDHDGIIFAAIVPNITRKSEELRYEEYLRKDHVFLLERYFYMLEAKQEFGLLVMDEIEKKEDRKLSKRIEKYYTSTSKGQYRAAWVVPSPFFVSSDMTYAVQAADVCIYAINWGYRLPRMEQPARTEIDSNFSQWLKKLQYKGTTEDGKHPAYGIVYIPDLFISRA
ncbi:MAG: DUF3800 domain-containing protein [Holosporales bacterium]|nr:DUF3800 domain-containing protein [Holosporales bacterium]